MSRPRRPKRPDLIGRAVSGPLRFASGLTAMLPFLMLDHMPSKLVLLALFAITAVLAGKRVRWSYFLILAASVTFFHLLAPVGRVLFEVGPLPVTAGALENGIMRSATLIGMVFLSLSAVRPELELPGRFGGLLTRTFYYFEVILDGKAGLSRRDFFGSLDRLLLDRFNPGEEDFGHDRQTAGPESGGRAADGSWRRGLLPAVLFVLPPWGFWILELLGLSWI